MAQLELERKVGKYCTDLLLDKASIHKNCFYRLLNAIIESKWTPKLQSVDIYVVESQEFANDKLPKYPNVDIIATYDTFYTAEDMPGCYNRVARKLTKLSNIEIIVRNKDTQFGPYANDSRNKYGPLVADLGWRNNMHSYAFIHLEPHTPKRKHRPKRRRKLY